MNTPATNPANLPAAELAKAAPTRKRIPMSVPRRKMEAPEIPGFHLHWFLESNVHAALQGGYEFVDINEVPTNQMGVGNDTTISGSADLGARVKIIAGTGVDNQPEYQVLMKIREEWWQDDQKVIEARNASVLSAIFKEEHIMGSDKVPAEDKNLRYVKTALFNRPTRK
jgi:hypothetical protein